MPELRTLVWAGFRFAGRLATPTRRCSSRLSYVLALVLVTLIATAPSHSQQSSKSTIQSLARLQEIKESPVAIVMQRGHETERSMAPIYEIQIFRSGTLIYRGEQNVRVRGYKLLRASPSRVTALITQLENLGFFSNPYVGYGRMRSSSRLLILDASDGTRSRRLALNDYFGSPPDDLALEAKLIDLIESIAPVTELRCPVTVSQPAVRRGLTLSGMEMCEYDWKVFGETFKSN